MARIWSYRSRLLASVLVLTLIEPAQADRHEAEAKKDSSARKQKPRPTAGPAILSVEPPPGFESLTKPREMLIDLVYAGEKLGQATVVVTPGKVEIKEPEKAAKLIPGVKEPDKVIAALTGALEANTKLVCRGPRNAPINPDCGVLDPAVAGVIFDENNLALQLFVAQPHLDPQALSTKRFLPRPDGEWGFLSRLDAALSGQTDQRQEHTVHNTSYLTFREARIHTDASLSTRNGLIVDALAFEMDRPEWFYAAGFFRGFGSALVPEARFYGGRVWSSTELRVDREQAFGSQLPIFLQRPSYVEILRDGRLLSTHYYPAGSRLIDTSGLPGGSYNITVRVREVGGETREETRFFAKSEILPPADQPLFFFDAGVLAEDRTSGLPRPSSVPIAKAAARVRIWHGFALGGEIAGTSKEGVFEGTAIVFTDWLRATGSALVTSALDYGLSGNIAVNYGKFGFYLNGRYLRASRPRIDRPAAAENFRFVNGNSLQASGSITYHLNRARLGFTGHYVRSNITGQRDTYAAGPNFQYTIHKSFEHTVDFETELLKTERGYSAFARLVWRWTPPTNYYVTANAGVRALKDRPGSTEVREVGQISGTYRLGPYFSHDFAIQPVVQRDGRTFAGVDVIGEGPLGRMRAGVHHSIGNGSAPSTGYGLNASTGFAIDKRGLAVGGKESHPAAVMVRVSGPPSAGKYRVFVNGSPKMLISPGEMRPLYLHPYYAYEISLRPAETNSGMANIGGVNRKVVLYPGTTRTLEWNVDPVIVVFGRVLNAGGAPIGNANIEGAVGIGDSDERGFFQVEVKPDTTLVFKTGSDGICDVRLQGLKADNGFARVGDVVCKPKS